MKKFIKITLFTIILFLVGILKVQAKEDITIAKVELEEKSEYATINEEVSLENNKIITNLSFTSDDDYVIYKLTIKNNDDKDYKIEDILDDNNVEYLKYEYIYEDNILGAKSEKEILLKITYVSLLPYDTVIRYSSDGYIFSSATEINLSFILTNYVKNPSTLDRIGKQSFTVILCVLLLFAFIKLRRSKFLYVLVLGLLLIPISTNAENEISISIPLETNLSVKINYLRYDYQSKVSGNYTKLEFIRTNHFPSDAVDLSQDCDGSIRGWIEDDTLYIGSNYKIFFPTSGLGYFFKGSLTEINFNNNVDTTFVTNMTHMFASNYKLTSLDLTSFRTGNVTSMENMFRGCTNLEEIDLSTFNTSKVTDMTSMFIGDSKLKKLDLSHFDMSNVTSMYAMIAECGKLEELIIDNWDLSKAYSVSGFINYFDSLKTISARNIILPVNANGMFNNTHGTTALESIDTTGWDLSHTNNISYLFKDQKKLYEIKGIEDWDTSNIIDMSYLLYNVGYNVNDKTIELDLSNWDISKVQYMSYMFEFLGYNAKEVYLSINNWVNSGVTSLEYTFANIGYNSDKVEINIDTFEFPNLENFRYAFYCVGQKADDVTINISNLSFESIVNLYEAFYEIGEYSNSVTLNLENFYIPNGTNVAYMFEYVGEGGHYVNINLTNWDLSTLVDANRMFFYVAANATEETNIVLKDIDFSNVTNMTSFFYNVGRHSKKFNIELDNFNAPSVTNMDYFFYAAGGLSDEWTFTGLDNINLENVTSMNSAFSCIGENNGIVRDLGTINLYGGNLNALFAGSYRIKATINLMENPTYYSRMFEYAANTEGSLITVNYTEDVVDIDNIINTKSSDSNVVKGNLIVR